MTSSLADVQSNDCVRESDTPCPRCGELLVEEKDIPVADQSEPVGWAIQDIRWC